MLNAVLGSTGKFPVAAWPDDPVVTSRTPFAIIQPEICLGTPVTTAFAFQAVLKGPMNLEWMAGKDDVSSDSPPLLSYPRQKDWVECVCPTAVVEKGRGQFKFATNASVGGPFKGAGPI